MKEGDVPEHLRHFPGVYVRTEDGKIVEAPAADQAVARQYPHWPDKGEVVGGRRLTIMTAKSIYEVGEEVRVIHVFEATAPGHEVYVMGPKPVHGEYVDGSLATPPAPAGEEPWVPAIYDGTVLESPAVDYGYEITTYCFSEAGRHMIVWKLGPLESNTLEIMVEESS